MLSVCLDTSFLISFADPTRKHHAAAVDYFRHCLGKGIPMFIPTLAAAEFQVGQPVTDLPLQNFRILPYNLPHAIKAASFVAALRRDEITKDEADLRKVVINDLNILGQAAEEGIPVLLTEDAGTLVRMADRLRVANLSTVQTVLLKDGFTPGRLGNPLQTEIALRPVAPNQE